jgi:hypothetical protein
LRDIKKVMPAPTSKAVDAIEGDTEERQQKIDKVDATLTAMKDSNSIAADLEAKAPAATEQAEKQEAAKRGPEKMRRDWHAELADLKALLNAVVFEVSIAEAEKHEQALIAALEDVGLDHLLGNINTARDQATAYGAGDVIYHRQNEY